MYTQDPILGQNKKYSDRTPQDPSDYQWGVMISIITSCHK